jgi:hypothetical protein
MQYRDGLARGHHIGPLHSHSTVILDEYYMHVVHIGIPIVAGAIEVGHKATSGLWSIIRDKAIARIQ